MILTPPEMIARARQADIVETARGLGAKLRRDGPDWVGPCPVCGGDDRFSAHAGKRVWNCRGCGKGGDVIDLVSHVRGLDFTAAVEDLAGATRLGGSDKKNGLGKLVATYDYVDEAGQLVMQSLRYEQPLAPGHAKPKKTFRQRCPDGAGGWIWKLNGVRLVPYRLPEVHEAIAQDRLVFVVEGERKADKLAALGIPATCSPMGARKWPDDFDEHFRGARVVILPDNDDDGRAHGAIVAERLAGIAADVRIVELPRLEVKEDIVEWLDVRGGTVEELNALVVKAPEQPAGMQQSTIKATPFVWIEPALIPRRQRIYGKHYIRKFISGTIAPGALGKSSLAKVETLAIVTGRNLLGVSPEESVPVWYWNGEDPLEELQRRIVAAALHYGIQPNEFDGRLFVDTGRTTKIIIAEQTKAGAVIARPVVESVIETILSNRIGLFIVDPFVASHRVTENDNPAIELVASTWAEIAERTGAAVELIHHARKTGGNEVTVEDGRGGSALLAKVRSARALNGMSEKEAADVGVNRKQYFRVANGKANLIVAPDKADWYCMRSVDLGNGGLPGVLNAPGDSVGVATRWEWPNLTATVTVSDLRAVQLEVSKGKWRESSQSPDWVGIPVAKVLRLELASENDKAKVKAALKMWLASGALVVVDGVDDARRPRKYVEVGEWAND